MVSTDYFGDLLYVGGSCVAGADLLVQRVYFEGRCSE
jgi:hypothetical protein